jgi:hypothetical protein
MDLRFLHVRVGLRERVPAQLGGAEIVEAPPHFLAEVGRIEGYRCLDGVGGEKVARPRVRNLSDAPEILSVVLSGRRSEMLVAPRIDGVPSVERDLKREIAARPTEQRLFLVESLARSPVPARGNSLRLDHLVAFFVGDRHVDVEPVA